MLKAIVKSPGKNPIHQYFYLFTCRTEFVLELRHCCKSKGKFDKVAVLKQMKESSTTHRFYIT